MNEVLSILFYQYRHHPPYTPLRFGCVLSLSVDHSCTFPSSLIHSHSVFFSSLSSALSAFRPLGALIVQSLVFVSGFFWDKHFGSLASGSSHSQYDEMKVPVIDLSQLQNNFHTKPTVMKQIQEACRSAGIFHVINHGISEIVIQEAMDVNASFFDLALTSKQKLISDDICKPVRFSPNQGGDQGISREFLKLYAHPFEEFVSSWPDNPPDYRSKMGRLAVEMRKLGIEILGAIMESLNLEVTYLRENIEQGMHIVAINSYPPISASDVRKIGATAHTDHSIITTLLQSSPGLQVMDRKKGTYGNVFPNLKGSIQVLVGDHLEALSNGNYKAVSHRVIQTSRDETRLSIASFQSLGMDEVLEPAVELVNEEHPKQYKGSSLRDYLKHLASGESKRFIETLKIASPTMEAEGYKQMESVPAV